MGRLLKYIPLLLFFTGKIFANIIGEKGSEVPFLEHNIDVAEKCCFIVRSPGNGTFILTNAFSRDCSTGCEYTLFENLYSESQQYCQEQITSPTCCSYSSGAFCQQYGNGNSSNNIQQIGCPKKMSTRFSSKTGDRPSIREIPKLGSCSNVCKEIADCSAQHSSWCYNENIRPIYSKPPVESETIDNTTIDFPEPVEQSAQVYPMALAVGSSSYMEIATRWGFARCRWFWNLTCYMAYYYCQYWNNQNGPATNWYKINGNWYWFKRACCSKMQYHCSKKGWKYTCPPGRGSTCKVKK